MVIGDPPLEPVLGSWLIFKVLPEISWHHKVLPSTNRLKNGDGESSAAGIVTILDPASLLVAGHYAWFHQGSKGLAPPGYVEVSIPVSYQPFLRHFDRLQPRM